MIAGIHPDLQTLAGNTGLFYTMMDIFKLLGHKVKIIGRIEKETRVKTKIRSPVFGETEVTIREGIRMKHFELRDLRQYHPIKHLTLEDIELLEIPLSHPFMYFDKKAIKVLRKADAVFTDAEIYVKLPERIPGIENKMIQYVHFPLQSLQPVKDRPPSMVWANSRFTANHVQKFWGLHVEIVHPPVYCDIYRNDRGFKSRPYDVVMFARLHPDKFTVLNELKGYRVAVVGSSYGFEKEIPSWVTLHENATLNQVVDVLSKSKVYVHAKGFGTYMGGRESLPEHLGITILEAMAAGCVPIVPDAGGPPEIVGFNEGHGFLFHNANELRDIISRLLQNEPLWRQNHERSLTRAKDFDVSVVNGRVDGLLRRIQKAT